MYLTKNIIKNYFLGYANEDICIKQELLVLTLSYPKQVLSKMAFFSLKDIPPVELCSTIRPSVHKKQTLFK